MAVCCDIRNARHVLVADDDENDVFLLRCAFRKAGLPHKLIHLQDGQQTIDYLSTKAAGGDNQSKPDLLLSVAARSENAAGGRIRRAGLVARPFPKGFPACRRALIVISGRG